LNNHQKSGPRFIKVSRLQSIKTKILSFALLATIIPSLIMGGLFYFQNSKLLHAKIANELRNTTVQASDKLEMWLKERLYDLRVFSNSYIISENLARMLNDRHSSIETQVARDHLKEYLKSVGDKFPVYEELMIIDLARKPVVTSHEALSADALPDQWLDQLQINRPIKGKIQFDPYMDRKYMYIAEAIKAADGRPLGVLAAKINIISIRSILTQQTVGGIDEIYILNTESTLMVSTSFLTHRQAIISQHSEKDSFAGQRQHREPTDYINHHNRAVVGMAIAITSMDWIMVAEVEKEKAYAEIFMLRRATIMLVGGLMFFIGILAYLFGHTLVRPLRMLSREAAGVASGNLEVEIPVSGLSEVSYLTQVFNHMVASLRRGREELSAVNRNLQKKNEELQQLSITDGLTRLYNRKHIMDLFDLEMSRSRRYGNDLAILMLDIDHFKRINDTYGHQVGDRVIQQVAGLLDQAVRDCDHVGRYGGEEFLMVLPDVDIQDAAVVAERIRQSVAKLQCCGEEEALSVTISIGIAGYPTAGENTESLLSSADNALYQAKTDGRNCVVVTQTGALPNTSTVQLLRVQSTR
jgi:diguanylate cyclase (GGDEF)-like protein